MRTRNYFGVALAMATLSLTACSSEENENPKPQEMIATLELKIEGVAASNTRATGSLPTGDADAPTTDEGKVTRLTIAIFNSDKSVNAIQEFTNITDFTKVTMNCTAGQNCTGIAVANAPAKTFAGITKRDDFIKKTVDLSQTITELLMSGEIKQTQTAPAASTTPFTLQAGKKLSMDVKLERLVARVSISSIKTAFDASGQYAKATFTLKKIFMHKVQYSYPVDPATPSALTVTSDIKTGWWDTGNAAWDGTIAFPNDVAGQAKTAKLVDAINGTSGIAITASAPFTTPYWFYTFPNKDATNATRLVIFGTFDPDGPLPQNPTQDQTANDQPEVDYYYPIVINKLQTGTIINDGSSNVTSPTTGKGDGTIVKNNKYTISATIKGKGGANPNVDLNPSTLELTITVAKWALNISQDVEFN